MKVWGFEIEPPSLDRRLAALLLDIGLLGRADRLLFERRIRPGGVVVDVGANQGILALLFSRLVGESGRVTALEPEPRLFAALEHACRANGAANVTPMRLAAGSERSRGVLHCSRLNGGDNRLTDTVAFGGSVDVEVVPLDELFVGQRVDFVKIDVQGYEMNVLRGMGAILDENPQIQVYFEYWPEGLSGAGSSPSEPLRFLADRGFRLIEPTRGGERGIEADEVVQTTGSGHFAYRNLLATRR